MIERILQRTLAEVEKRRCRPESTYRLQFHSEFTFRDARAIIPYLQELGITHCYASPYLKARPTSKHGYDITDHRVLNPEIGTRDDYDAWIADLHRAGIGQILDTVPNHMGVHPSENPWWADILENGPASPYARYFDIAWYASPRRELHGKLLLPILGDLYGKVLESQQLKLSHDNGAFILGYYDNLLPVAPRSYGLILARCLDTLKQQLGDEALPVLEYQSILTSVRNLPESTETDPLRLAEQQREKEVIKRRLGKLAEESPEVRQALEQTVDLFRGHNDEPRSFDALDQLLGEQAYRLSFWRVASDEINYRRFFDVNELAALSMERDEVFQATHELIFELIRTGAVNGLRIDHPDGLYDPRQYLARLQERYLLALARSAVAEDAELKDVAWESIEAELRTALEPHVSAVPLYVVVEKILASDEPLPEDWQTQGTSGYDFLNQLNGVFVDTGAEREFRRLYHDWVEDDTTLSQLVYQKKTFIMTVSLSSELNMLAHQLDALAQQDRWSRDFTLHAIRQALRAVIAAYPVYRSYIADRELSDTDRKYVQRAIRVAKLRNRSMSPELFDFIRDMLLLKPPRSSLSEGTFPAEQRRFAGKFQQVTAPVMAKGLEDTAFYVYNRLISLNEVGGDPGRFGIAPPSLHRAWQQRQTRWPYAFSTTSTHDTKRSEDVRARINVLSEMPEEWLQALARWRELNNKHRVTIDEDLIAPDASEECLLYQTLLGAWPLAPLREGERDVFVQRIREFMRKALHEAKVHTSWINPDPAYDEAVLNFVSRILDPAVSSEFLEDFRSFEAHVRHFGLFNAVAQTLLKSAAPGVADTYQGTELWDFSLVDPDNRRPVDYTARRETLARLDDRVKSANGLAAFAEELVRDREDGRIKLYVLSRMLRYRRAHPGLLSAGVYRPLDFDGKFAEHLFGFARTLGEDKAIVVVPRLLLKMTASERKLPLGEVWADTRLVLPDDLGALRWANLFTGEESSPASRSLRASEMLGRFPVAFLSNA